uniref:RxLR effector candidate protein n=1 Tax=Hyaloperonospora arabidopsidis (strain Emoy2) TaxID=559515 RepID=M4BNP2_HYAAE
MYSAEVTKLSSDAVFKLQMGKRKLFELNEFFYWCRDSPGMQERADEWITLLIPEYSNAVLKRVDMWLEENREPEEVFALMPEAVRKPFSPSMDVYEKQMIKFFLLEWLTYVRRFNIKNPQDADGRLDKGVVLKFLEKQRGEKGVKLILVKSLLRIAIQKLGAFEQVNSNASAKRFKFAAE